MTTCPVCEKGKLKKRTINELMFGVSLGRFPAEICTACGESFTNEETTRKIEAVAKEKGLWGLGSKGKITRSGNSLAIRIPKRVADFLGLKEGKETYIHPDQEKLVIEPLGQS
jgi:hypothetical protein